MQKPHMPQAIITPCKAPARILAVAILTQRPALRSKGAVAARHMTLQIPCAVEPLGFASRDVAFEGTAVGFEMFAAQLVSLLCMWEETSNS